MIRRMSARLKALVLASPVLALVVAFAGGIIAWGGFNTFMEATNRLSFCISCHEMRSTVYEEYKPSVHSHNASGVQAVCADCHVPREWTAKLVRKIKASREIAYWLMGTIDTREKFEARRPELARRVWDSLEATDSQECRNCHNFTSMKTGGQARFAAQRHAEAAAEGKTCITCHKGISHQLPQAENPPEPQDPGKLDLAGQDINTTCAPCHGRNGQGSLDGTYPRLAGLDADYLARQLRAFKDRSRINIPMFPYSTERELPEGDILTISRYLSRINLTSKLGAGKEGEFDALARLQESKDVLNIPLFSGNVEAGKRSYDRECAGCHGADGAGTPAKKAPALAGQHSSYIQRQIAEFRKGERRHETRSDREVFGHFGEAEINDILAYLSTLDDD